MRVQMMVTISGGRADGTEWPPAGEVLETSDREGAELCQAQLAVPAAFQVPAETAVMPAAGVETRSAGPEPAVLADPQPATATRPPIVNAPKQAWVDHAVAQGHDPVAAAAMRKADLIAQYGG